MKVTFIYPDFFQYEDGSFMPEGRMYLGVAYLSAVLKQASKSAAGAARRSTAGVRREVMA